MLVVSPAGMSIGPAIGWGGSGWRPSPSRRSTPVDGFRSVTYPTRKSWTSAAGIVAGPVRSPTDGVTRRGASERTAIWTPSYSSRAATTTGAAIASAGRVVAGKTFSAGVADHVSTAAEAAAGARAPAARAAASQARGARRTEVLSGEASPPHRPPAPAHEAPPRSLYAATGPRRSGRAWPGPRGRRGSRS